MHLSNPDDHVQKSPPPNGDQQSPAADSPALPPSNYPLVEDVPPPPTPPTARQLHGSAQPVPWSTGLCGCFSDVRNCCITCWCPCITFGQIAEIVDRGSTSCGASGALYALINMMTGCACIYSCFYRSKLRRQHTLPETPCPDCVVHFCCETCALCQEYRELKHVGFDMFIEWLGNVQQNQGVVTMPPFVQGGMRR